MARGRVVTLAPMTGNRTTLPKLFLAGLLAGTVLLGTLQPAMAQNAEAVRYYNSGIKAYNQGNLPEAVRQFQMATTSDPQYANGFFNLGGLYYQMKRYAEARDAFQRTAMLNPNDMEAKYNLALALEKLGDNDEAIRILRQIPPGDARAADAHARVIALQSKMPQPMTNALTSQPDPNAKRMVETFSRGFDGPTGMVIGSGGFLYVANYSKNQIYKVGANGEKTVFVQGDTIQGPIGMAYDPKTGDLYVANYLGNKITRISPEGKANVLASGLKKPYNLYLDTVNHSLYVSEQETNVISRINLQ